MCSCGEGKVVRIPLDAVRGGYRRRMRDDSLTLLAASIARHGLLQPVVVRRTPVQGCYALVLGFRRLQACRMLGLSQIDAIVIEADECEALCCALEEEHTRKPAHFLEEADAIRHTGCPQLWTHSILDPGFFRGRLRYAQLGEELCAVIRRFDLSMEQTAPLFAVRDPARRQEAAFIIADRGLTPAQAERLICGGVRRTAVPRREDAGETARTCGRKRRRRIEKMT